MRRLAVILLLLPLALNAQSRWEVSLGGEYTLTAEGKEASAVLDDEEKLTVSFTQDTLR